MKKILLIEDESVLKEVLAHKLKASGYDVYLVKDSPDSIQMMRDIKPDVILLDMILPIMNGFEILKQKKADSQIASIPVIVLTNSIEPMNNLQLADFGITKFIIKTSTTPDEIINVVKSMIDNATLDDVANNGLISKEQVDEVKPSIMAGKNILVVEDDEFLTSILCSRLRSTGTNAVQARTGEEALEEIKKGLPDLILLDILLPGIDGYEVLKQIRNSDKTKNIPVIIMSNFSQLKDKKKAADLSADFLVKALVNPDDIVKKVEDTLRFLAI